MKTTNTITGTIVTRETNTIFGSVLLPDYSKKGTFEWSQVKRAGEYVTYGIKGARSLVELDDGTMLQIAVSKLSKANKKKLAEIKGKAGVPSRCSDQATQMVAWGDEVTKGEPCECGSTATTTRHTIPVCDECARITDGKAK